MGFGTKDASKRDEFAATIRTEQYRETLKRENTILDEQRDRAKEEGKCAKALQASSVFVQCLHHTAPHLPEPQSSPIHVAQL